MKALFATLIIAASLTAHADGNADIQKNCKGAVVSLYCFGKQRSGSCQTMMRFRSKSLIPNGISYRYYDHDDEARRHGRSLISPKHGVYYGKQSTAACAYSIMNELNRVSKAAEDSLDYSSPNYLGAKLSPKALVENRPVFFWDSTTSADLEDQTAKQLGATGPYIELYWSFDKEIYPLR